jgi:galactokinase
MATQIQVLKTFAAKFTTDPFLFFSPGRINLIGEHIDYNDGFVMPAAIEQGIWFAVAPNYTENIHIIAADLNERIETNTQSISKQSGWKNYLLSALHILQKNGHTFHGFDCVFGGNLPLGAGLSSSAAVECGLLFAINHIFSLGLLKPTIALYGQQAEHAFPDVKCGIMDQFASVFGKANHFILLDCETIEHEYLPFPENYQIVLINSMVTHSLASGEYNTRRKQCRDGFSIVKNSYPTVQSFRQVTIAMLESLRNSMEPLVFNRCLYVVQEIERTQKVAYLLQQNNLQAVGKLMFDTHWGLSKLYQVSCLELDVLVTAAQNAGATGSRLMGGGFGGCTINLIEKEKAAIITSAIVTAFQQKFNQTPSLIEVKPGNGTSIIPL